VRGGTIDGLHHHLIRSVPVKVLLIAVIAHTIRNTEMETRDQISGTLGNALSIHQYARYTDMFDTTRHTCKHAHIHTYPHISIHK
jgi:hypothetical protein